MAQRAILAMVQLLLGPWSLVLGPWPFGTHTIRQVQGTLVLMLVPSLAPSKSKGGGESAEVV